MTREPKVIKMWAIQGDGLVEIKVTEDKALEYSKVLSESLGKKAIEPPAPPAPWWKFWKRQ